MLNGLVGWCGWFGEEWAALSFSLFHQSNQFHWWLIERKREDSSPGPFNKRNEFNSLLNQFNFVDWWERMNEFLCCGPLRRNSNNSKNFHFLICWTVPLVPQSASNNFISSLSSFWRAEVKRNESLLNAQRPIYHKLIKVNKINSINYHWFH